MNKEGVTPSKYAVKPTMKHKANSPGYGGKAKETGPGIHVLPMPGESTNSLNAYGRRADKRHSGKGPAAWNDKRPQSTMDQDTGGPAPRMPSKVKPAECKKRYQGKPIE
jgi:hypothetical protein